ncbi:MAG: DeoR/GlpR family DNA-binding transcription regulator [Clostridia bacterium]|jgi:DeoR/GlpR family transcriptional regulator of sugar metabolism
MFAIERQQEIINILKAKRSVSVVELSKKFFIGEATIRRDLGKLEKMGLLKRTYGGAVLLEGLDLEIPLSVRESEQKKEKDNIGRLASQLVQDGDIIIMDSSSTTLRMVPYLQGKSALTVITNGAKTAIELGELLRIKVYSTGGMLRENSLSYIGELARKCIEGFYVDTVFFSCRALSMEKGLTDSNGDEAELRRLMIQNSRKAVLLCDHTKLDKISFSRIGDFADIDYIVVDQKPSYEWINFLQEKNVQIIHNS